MKTISIYAAAFLYIGILSIQALAEEVVNDDLRVNGELTVNSTKIDISDPEAPNAFAYPALRLNAFDISNSDIDWVIGMIAEGATDQEKALVFFNEARDTLPFIVVNNAVDGLLSLDGSSVVINDVVDENLVGTADLIVGGNILSSWEGSNTGGDGLKNLLVLSANNSEADKSSDAGFGLKNAREDIQWNFRTHQGGTAFVATLAGTGGPEFTIKNSTSNVSGTELYLGNGAKNVSGVWINASSRALKENIKELSTQDALEAFHKLQPVTYNYKSDKKEQVVGFIAEDVPELVAIQGRDGLSPMDMVAVLTKVVQEQDKSLAETKAELKIKDKRMTKMEAEIDKLQVMQKRLSKVESLLTNLALDTSNIQKEKVSIK